MKIAQIVPSLAEKHGGPSRSVLQLSAVLAEDSMNEVTLLSTTAQTPSENHAGPLHVRVAQRDWPASICSSQTMEKILRGGSWDVVHHHGLWLRTVHYAQVVAAADRVPFVLSPRGMASPWAWGHHRWRKALAAAILHPGAFAAVSGWHATSGSEADDLRRLGFGQPVCVAPNGVTIPSDADLAAAREFWKAFCPEIAGRRVALFYSRFHSKKRVVELIGIWTRIAPPDWHLLVIGIPEQFSVEQLQNRMGAATRSSITVHSGIGRPAPYAVASLFVLPTHHENFGMVIAEALAAGVPAFVTDTTPWQKLPEVGGGWCVAWDKFEPELRRALTEDSAELARRGARARDWVHSEFSWKKSAGQLQQFYADLSQQR